MAAATIGALRVNLSANTAAFSKGLKGANDNLSRFSKQAQTNMRGMQTAIAGISKAFGALGVAFGGRQLVASIRSTVSEMSALAKAADRIGVATDQFQKLGHAAKLAGVEQNQFTTAMERFSRMVGEAAQGTGELAPILEANNIALRDSEGNMRSVNDLLEDFAELIRNAASAQDRMVLAQKAFGRGGAEMVNMLAKGRRGMQEAGDEAERLNLVIGDKLLRSAEDVDDEFARLSSTFSVKWKSSILVAVDATSQLIDKLGALQKAAADVGNAPFFERLARLLGVPEGGHRLVPGQGIMPSRDAARQQLADMLRRGQIAGGEFDADEFLGRAGQTTRLPSRGRAGGAGSRSRATSEVERQQEAVRQLIEQLEHEHRLIGMTATQQEVANALRQAGSAATEEQRIRITGLVEGLAEAQAAMQRAAEAQQLFESTGMRAFDSLTEGTFKFRDALADLAKDIARLFASRAFTSLAGSLFGGGGLALDLPKFARGGSHRVGGTMQ